MKSRPILFNGDMVRALLAGGKTQTRRIVKPQPAGAWAAPGRSSCPFGLRGDLLWVREKWDFRPWRASGWVNVAYAADGYTDTRECPMNWNPTLYNYQRWRPSIHMPRWASRLTLRITDVRVQRLQSIVTHADDILAEGVIWDCDWPMIGPCEADAGGLVEQFSALWNSINGDDSWTDDPWVWAITFEVIRKNVDEVMA